MCLFVHQPNCACCRFLRYCQSGLKISFRNSEEEDEQGENNPNPNNGEKTQDSRREGEEPRHCYGSQRKGDELIPIFSSHVSLQVGAAFRAGVEHRTAIPEHVPHGALDPGDHLLL